MDAQVQFQLQSFYKRILNVHKQINVMSLNLMNLIDTYREESKKLTVLNIMKAYFLFF